MIYLDNHATTPCDPQVVETMLPYFTQFYGNPSSTLHSSGQNALKAVQKAKEQTSSLIGSSPAEILFTSGATESNNLAILGLARGLAKHTERKKIITTKIEHKAIIEPMQELQRIGFNLVYLPIDSKGSIDLNAAKQLIDKDTLLVSVQAANNEIGTIQPIKEISKLVHAVGAIFHTDAAQAIGKVSVDVDAWDVDLLSISAHKFYGPKGVGALYIRGGVNSLPIEPLWFGGGQESGIRSGTVNVPGIVGLGKACELGKHLLGKENIYLTDLRNNFEKELVNAFPKVKCNGNLENRLPNNLSLTFQGLDAEALIVNMPEFAISTGSACNSGALEPSHVLQEIGLSREQGYSTLRIGLGRFTTKRDLEKLLEQLKEKVNDYIFN